MLEEKKNINLLPVRESPQKIIGVINRYYPILSFFMVIIFTASYILLNRFHNDKAKKYQDNLKIKSEYERKLIGLLPMENDYYEAYSYLEAVKKIKSEEKDFLKALERINQLKISGIDVLSLSISSLGEMSVNISASSSSSLDKFAENLRTDSTYNEDLKQIYAQGISRDSSGKYFFSLNIKADQLIKL